MTLADGNRTEARWIILRDVLDFIASDVDSRASIAHILQVMVSDVGAVGGYIHIFSDPRLLISLRVDEQNMPGDDKAKSLVALLNEPFEFSPPALDATFLGTPHTLVAPIRSQKQPVGLLVLALPAHIAPSRLSGQDPFELVHVLLNLLKVVSLAARAAARHEKLGRNQSEFMRIVSHDLRSPLTSIQGFASMLEQGTVGEINERQAYFVEKILSGVTQMTSLVDNIQDAGRYDPETGFYEMERSPCDVAEVVSKIIKNHLVPAEKQELSLSAVVADDVPIIQADVNMLERAVINLVDNAIKYTPNGGRVEVGVRRRGDEVVVSVRDTGLGISQDHQKMLFERHFRIPRREHKKVKGSGLGLFIVRSVAQRHGGTAWVESQEGQGSTFSFSIPLNQTNSLLSDVANPIGDVQR